MDEADLLTTGRNIKNKLNRFNKAFERKLFDLEEYEMATADERFFDQSFVEVDRIIYSTELFPIIHPKKANEIKGKWTENLTQVVSKLLNFTKDGVHYGVYFMEPVDPDREGIPNYRKVIQNPMDLGTCLNRVYLDYYKTPTQFWNELGLVFKNCRKFNKDSNSDIRILCDTLREVALELYKQWYKMSKEKYDALLQEYRERPRPAAKEDPYSNADDKNEIKRQTELEIKNKENEMQKILAQFENFQNASAAGNNSNPQ
mmetsp:Transcript_39794/g.35512  ORF Transcript_39794/g.35512 Transcript_39794/m.35512 type:complete len:259 (+) Transcript_39794:509-1285(+)